MPTRGIRLERGRLRAYVRVQGELHTKRFPLGTAEAVMLAWRASVVGRAAPAPSSLSREVVAYLKLKRDLPTYDTRRDMMRDWARALGPLRTITTQDVARVLADWQKTRTYAASTLNHRRSALSDFFRRMRPDAPNPVAGVPKFREPRPEPRGLPYRVIRALLGAMPRGRTWAHLSVLAYTGMSPSTIARLRAEHVDWQAGTVQMPGRRKGAGTASRARALTRQGLAALGRLQRLNAWGSVASSTRCVVFRRALAVVRRRHPDWPIPADVRPYDLRHSFGTAVYRASQSLTVTAGLMGHMDGRTTLRYIGAAVDDVERAVVAKLSRRLR